MIFSVQLDICGILDLCFSKGEAESVTTKKVDAHDYVVLRNESAALISAR